MCVWLTRLNIDCLTLLSCIENQASYFLPQKSKYCDFLSKITSNLHSWTHARFSKWDHFHWHQKLMYETFLNSFLYKQFDFFSIYFDDIFLGWFFWCWFVSDYILLSNFPPYVRYYVWWRHKALCMKCIAQRIFMQFSIFYIFYEIFFVEKSLKENFLRFCCFGCEKWEKFRALYS